MPAPDNRDTTPAGCSAGADTGAPAEDPAAPAEDAEFSFFVLRRVKESERRTLDMAPKTVTLEAVFSSTRVCTFSRARTLVRDAADDWASGAVSAPRAKNY